MLGDEIALKRLAQLLSEKNECVELVAAGGMTSVMLFGSRQMTRDIDVIIPKNCPILLDQNKGLSSAKYSACSLILS